MLVTIAVIAAAAHNALSPLGIRWTLSPDGRVGIPQVFESRLPQVSAADALRISEDNETIFIDVRDEKDYREAHIPGAINLPMREWSQLEAEVQRRLPKDARLVLYCYGGDCGLSTRMGKRLLELGYQHPIVLRRGWVEWKEAGYATVHRPREETR